MPFMQPQVYFGQYFAVEANHGETHIVPADVVGHKTGAPGPFGRDVADYIEGTVDAPDEEIEVKEGWLARLSAPGFLDCTDWSAHATEREALDYLDEMYGEGDQMSATEYRPQEPVIDVTVENHGSVVLFHPRTDVARDWIAAHVGEATWFAGRLVVEPRYAGDLFDGMADDGLELR